MLILKVISRLLDYPTNELQQAHSELVEIVQSDKHVSDVKKPALLALIDDVCTRDIYEVQSEYDAMFEKSRTLSLLLFEHVHGESRDRGQAMVDLINVYQSKGYDLSVKELPDYLPLFLEFLSGQDGAFIREYLQDVAHILALLEERLKKRKSHYMSVFSALIELSGVSVSSEEILAKVNLEKPDDTFEAIDEAWEDKEIRFDEPLAQPNAACPLSQRHAKEKVDSSLELIDVQNVPTFLNGE